MKIAMEYRKIVCAIQTDIVGWWQSKRYKKKRIAEVETNAVNWHKKYILYIPEIVLCVVK